MAFVAYDLSLQLIRELRGPYVILRRHDAKEAEQLRSAANGITRSVAEGGGRAGKDRLHLFRIAYASGKEVRSCLDLAAAWGVELAAPHATLDRLLGVLYGLTR